MTSVIRFNKTDDAGDPFIWKNPAIPHILVVSEKKLMIDGCLKIPKSDGV
jgi:hypothetical protein